MAFCENCSEAFLSTVPGFGLTLFLMFVKIAGRNGRDAPFSFSEGDD